MSSSEAPVLALDGRKLTLEEVLDVAYRGLPVRLDDVARGTVEEARASLEGILAQGDACYGVNTGFGVLSNVRIPDEQMSSLQHRLLMSHAAGVGDPLPEPAVRAMLLLRANTLARGHSGVRPLVIDRLLELLNRNLLPVVPSRGSVGASGDLAPLSHLALPLIGCGELSTSDGPRPAAAVLDENDLEPLVLAAKEGLALINGTQAMTALLALAVGESLRLAKAADLIGALSTDALRGTDAAFDARIHVLRPHPGQVRVARNLWGLLQDSSIRESHRRDDARVQDPYCLRCMPQVHGAVRDVIDDVARKVEIEINSVTDNPLIFPEEGDILSGGNFHGEPMALAADVLAMAVSELGSIAERRIDKLTDSNFSGLAPFLVEESGLNSGFMLAQVTAAALVSENKILCHPASVDSISTSAGKEDHVSMGMTAALKLTPILEHVRDILAVELLAAGQGIDLLRPLRCGGTLEGLHAELRQTVDPWTEDREMWPDIRAAATLIQEKIDPYLSDLE